MVDYQTFSVHIPCSFWQPQQLDSRFHMLAMQLCSASTLELTCHIPTFRPPQYSPTTSKLTSYLNTHLLPQHLPPTSKLTSYLKTHLLPQHLPLASKRSSYLKTHLAQNSPYSRLIKTSISDPIFMHLIISVISEICHMTARGSMYKATPFVSRSEFSCAFMATVGLPLLE